MFQDANFNVERAQMGIIFLDEVIIEIVMWEKQKRVKGF